MLIVLHTRDYLGGNGKPGEPVLRSALPGETRARPAVRFGIVHQPRQQAILGLKLVGLYLRGSLALGDFDPLTSDVDVLCVTATELGHDELEALTRMHLELAESPSRYANELELIYLTRAAAWCWQPDETHPMLSRGSGELVLKMQNQNWVLERWSVLRGATALYGPPPATLIRPPAKVRFGRECGCRVRQSG